MKKTGIKKIDSRVIKIAEKLRKMRIDKGFTSYEHFAWDNEIGRQQYWRMEKGRINPSIYALKKLAAGMEVSIGGFLKDL